MKIQDILDKLGMIPNEMQKDAADVILKGFDIA